MKYVLLCALILLASPASAWQENPPAEAPPATEAAAPEGEGEAKPAAPPTEEQPTPEAISAEEDQNSVKALSLQGLEEADEKMLAEREKWAKTERRLNMLLEDLGNRTADIENKTKNLEKLLDDNRKKTTTGPPKITQVQIDHWNSRDAKVAARDFVLLYKKEPEVGIGIIKGMKKKKSAELIDAVSNLDATGREVAARLHEAIGVGKVQQ